MSAGDDELHAQIAAAVAAKRERSDRARRAAIVVCAYRDPRDRTCGRRLAEILVDVDGARTVELRPGARWSADDGAIVVHCPTHGPERIPVDRLEQPTPVGRGAAEIRIHDRSLP